MERVLERRALVLCEELEVLLREAGEGNLSTAQVFVWLEKVREVQLEGVEVFVLGDCLEVFLGAKERIGADDFLLGLRWLGDWPLEHLRRSVVQGGLFVEWLVGHLVGRPGEEGGDDLVVLLGRLMDGLCRAGVWEPVWSLLDVEFEEGRLRRRVDGYLVDALMLSFFEKLQARVSGLEIHEAIVVLDKDFREEVGKVGVLDWRLLQTRLRPLLLRNPRNGRAQWLMTALLYKQGNFRQAVRRGKAWLRDTPSPKLLDYVLLSLMRLERYEEAIEVFCGVAELLQGESDFYNALGNVICAYARSGQAEEGVVALLDYFPSSFGVAESQRAELARLVGNIACLYALSGDVGQSVYYSRKARDLGRERSFFEDDSDFDGVRGSEEFLLFLSECFVERESHSYFERLRGLLLRLPSEENWEAVKGLFGEWPGGKQKRAGLDYADGHLGQWPERLRRVSVMSGAGLGMSDWPTCPRGEPFERWSLVRTVDLSGVQMRRPCAPLFLSEHMARVSHLLGLCCLSGCLEVLWTSSRMEGLWLLELASVSWGSRYVPVLMKSTTLVGLRHLVLNRLMLSDADLAALLRSPVMGQLETLDIRGNQSGNEVVMALRTLSERDSRPFVWLSRGGMSSSQIEELQGLLPCYVD